MWLFIVPFIIAAASFILPSISRNNFKILAVVLSLIPLAILIYGQSGWVGSKVEYAWLPALSIEFYLRVDSLSLVFLYLTAVIVPITLLAVRPGDIPYPNVFYGLVFLLEGLLIGFFIGARPCHLCPFLGIHAHPFILHHHHLGWNTAPVSGI